MTRKQKKTLLRLILSVFLTAAVWIPCSILTFDIWLVGILFAVPYIIIGYDVIFGAVRNARNGRVFDEKLLMTIATLGAFATADFPEAVAVMIFYQLGELFQSIAVGKSRRSIASLMDIRPDSATVIRNGEEIIVSPEEVLKGETVVIRAGEKIAIDGIVIDGMTSVNTMALTGESLPVDKKKGDRVISGSVNHSGVIKVRTDREYENCTVSRILALVEESSARKARIEGFITRFARWYTPFVVTAALALAVIPSIITGQWGEWVRRALIFLVVSCPCALVVSVPLTFFGGIGGASRAGILVKGANYLELLANVDTVAFDKTGTVTKGVFVVNAIHSESMTKEELLDIAAAAESFSLHPVAKSIIDARKGGIDKNRIGEVSEIVGRGVKAVVDGKTYYVGNAALMEDIGAKWRVCHMTGTVIHVSEDDKYLGHIVISDEIKSDSDQAIAELKKLGIKNTVILTGDRRDVAESVAKSVGIDGVHAELLPEDKVNKVDRLIRSGARLAFVGDGINDAPVLSRADVGVAMGALGSDSAIESADVVIMDDKLTKLPVAIRIARKTVRIARENVVIALVVKAVLLLLGSVGAVGMWIAVFGDVGVLIIAVLNAMRSVFGKVR